MIRLLDTATILPTAYAALGSGASTADLLAQALRRASALLAPASAGDLLRFVWEPLDELGIDRPTVEAALEDRISYGDILEMRRLDSDPWDAPERVLRPAPPAYVHRTNGDYILLGVAGALASPLTPELEARVASLDGVRVLRPGPGEQLEAHLHLLGLVKLSEQAWLRLPDREDAAAHLSRWSERLHPVSPGGLVMDGIELLDPGRSARYYRGRWVAPDPSTEGLRIARRPQLYGAALWSLLEFAAGRAVGWLDFNADRDGQRPFDVAWRLQAAIDAQRGVPQEVRITRVGDRIRLDFFSPLPGFAERRLALVGDKQPGDRSLFGFLLDDEAVKEEIASLEALLWMRAVKGEDG